MVSRKSIIIEMKIVLGLLYFLHVAHSHSIHQFPPHQGQPQSPYHGNQFGGAPTGVGGYGGSGMGGGGFGGGPGGGFGGGAGGGFGGGAGGGFGGGPGGQFPQISCPNLFSYKYDLNQGGWFGLVITPKSRMEQEFDLEVNMTINKAVAQSDNIKLSVLSTQDEIFNGQVIRWAVRFPYQDMLPKLTQIKFNQQFLCSNQPDPLMSGVTQTSMWAKAMIRTSAGGQGPHYGGIGGMGPGGSGMGGGMIGGMGGAPGGGMGGGMIGGLGGAPGGGMGGGVITGLGGAPGGGMGSGLGGIGGLSLPPTTGGGIGGLSLPPTSGGGYYPPQKPKPYGPLYQHADEESSS